MTELAQSDAAQQEQQRDLEHYSQQLQQEKMERQALLQHIQEMESKVHCLHIDTFNRLSEMVSDFQEHRSAVLSDR